MINLAALHWTTSNLCMLLLVYDTAGFMLMHLHLYCTKAVVTVVSQNNLSQAFSTN